MSAPCKQIIMRKIYPVLLTVVLFAFYQQTVSASGNERTPVEKKTTSSPLACPVPGLYTIGPGGDYVSITAALADLYSCASITGPYIFELKATYVSTVEIFPITINAIPGTNAGNTITFRPETGATGLSISSGSAVGTILYDGGDYITFDGRPGGTGTSRELTIQNTVAGNAYAIRFANDASFNIITYCNIKSSNNNVSGGTIMLSGTSGTTGNDNISIDNNIISDAAAGTPNNAIFSAGSTTGSLYNNDVQISNNTFLNFYSATGDMAGVKVTQGCSDWTISNNIFAHNFGTAKAIAGIFSAINVFNSQMSNFTISGNRIGGPVAMASGGNFNLNGSGSMQVIRLSLATSPVSSIQGNSIWNIIFISVSSSPVHSLYNLADGAYNVGTVTPNVVGSSSSLGNIAVSLNSNVATNNFSIINCGSGSTGIGTMNISNNAIGNIDMAGTSTTCGFQLINFSGNSGSYTISNNTLGSSTYLPSVNHFLNTSFAAISGNLSSGIHTISNNGIYNIWAPGIGSNAILYGIRVQGNATYHISDNTISGCKSYATSAAGYTVVGISNTATANNQQIRNNKLSIISTESLALRGAAAGIYYAGAAGGTNVIEKNLIHSFSPAATSTNILTAVVGIHAAGGSADYINNMIRLGINSAGLSIATAFDMEGIYETGGTNNFYFNSVYIGGSGVTAGSNSAAFNSTLNPGTARTFKNNIFWNARSDVSGTSPSHYAIKIGGTAGVSSDANVLLATGSGKVLGNIAGTDFATLAAWRTAIGGDANSYSVNPQFVNPTGNSTTVDLHIKPSPTASIVEANGQLIATVTDDYDAQARASFSQTDIGADAGNFTAVSKADMGAINMLNPASFACLNATAQVKVVIKNYNTASINFASAPVTVSVTVSGTLNTTINTTINAGVLAAGDTLIVTMPSTIDMSAPGIYNFSISTAVGGTQTDVDITNDTYTVSVTPGTYNIGTLSSSVINFCNAGIPVLSLTGSIGTVQWQQSLTSGGPWTNVGANSLTYTPAAITATTYYQALVSCGASSNATNEVAVLVIPASIANASALADGVAVLTVCEGNNVTLTQTGGSIVAGAQWQWYEGTPANNFITPVGSPSTAADAATVIVPTINATYYLRASGGTSPCDGNVPAVSTGNPVATVIVNPIGTWLGNNTNWNDTGNWCNGVPTALSDAIIPTGLLNYPVISSNNSVRNINIHPGASVTIDNAGELTIRGNYINSSGTIANNGKIILNGTAVQNFPGATATVAAMKNIEVNNAAGVSIDKAFAFTGTLQPANGSISLNNNDITIYSDAVATASVGPLGNSAAFDYNGSGKFVVQRFIPAKRAWRLLTAPVSAATAPSINAAWQEGATQWPMGPATVTSNPADGFGTHISGGTNANGYDQNVNGNPSIKVFNGSSWLGLSVATSMYTKKVTDEQGYMLFVRGSRAVDLSYGTATVPNTTTLRVSGKLNVANVSALPVTSTGLTVVGNPFASAINFNNLATQNGFTQAENKYYLWDPTLAGSNGVGAWVTLAYNGSSYDRTVVAANDYTSSGGSQGIDDIGTIQSGAAFMMDFGAGTKTVNFNETVKANGSTVLVFRPANRQLRTNLHTVNSDGSTSLIDGILTTYNPAYNNDADGMDIDKLSNFSENFGLIRQGRVVAIERRKPVTVSDTLFFKMTQMKLKTYQFEFVPDSMVSQNLACYLEDRFLNSRTPVSLVAATKITFDIPGVDAAAADRFRLVFKPWLQFATCLAVLKNDNVEIEWKAAAEDAPDHFEIERSADGEHFITVASRAHDNANTTTYHFTDLTASTGDYYYRIKVISKNAVIAYSNVAGIRVLRSNPALYVFPNPVINNRINVQVGSKLPKGNYALRLLNAEGKTMLTEKISHPGGTATYQLNSKQPLVPGTYQLEIALPNSSRQLIQVLVQ